MGCLRSIRCATFPYFNFSTHTFSIPYSNSSTNTLVQMHTRTIAHHIHSCQSSPANPGLVSIIYDAITTDVFGLKNLGVGMFGMLKGRATYIPTAYFDGSIWIERGVSSGAATGGEEYYNVYAREEE